MTPPRDPNVLRTTVGDLQLEEYHLTLDGRAWRILHTGAVVSHDDEQRFLGAEVRIPYGVALWPSSIALAHEIATRPMAGKRVLELGAGTGLPGIVAATLGARVVQTDIQEVALHVAKRNAERNGVTLELREADWTAWTDAATYDVILGSDILYANGVHAQLRKIFEGNLAPGGTVLIADPFRKASFSLFEAMEKDGWRATVAKWTVATVPPPRAIGVFALTRG